MLPIVRFLCVFLSRTLILPIFLILFILFFLFPKCTMTSFSISTAGTQVPFSFDLKTTETKKKTGGSQSVWKTKRKKNYKKKCWKKQKKTPDEVIPKNMPNTTNYVFFHIFFLRETIKEVNENSETWFFFPGR